ncbi:MAG: class I SAM-dependent methyltransferase [Promethearchaeia archaeon]
MNNIKQFYEKHINFSGRTIIEYYISPGIQCKFEIIKKFLEGRQFHNALDLGCSGNSLLYFLKHIKRKFFYDIASRPLIQYANLNEGNSICGDLIKLPFRDNFFDFVSALDVLEHIKHDKQAISEISRIVTKGGIVVITVPHLKKFYTAQDKLIGHYRRYEIPEVIKSFSSCNLKMLTVFGVYGQLMKIADLQGANPQATEGKIEILRKRYINNTLFRKIWDIFVRIGATFMMFDALHQSKNRIMNIAFVFRKK